MRYIRGMAAAFAIVDTWKRTGRGFATPVLAFRTVDGLVVGVRMARPRTG